MTDHFVDTSVFLMAVGGAHAQRDDSRAFLEAVASSGDRLHTSVETIQEFVFHRMRRTDRARAVSAARALSGSCVLHTFDDEVVAAALRLIDETEIRGRDAGSGGDGAGGRIRLHHQPRSRLRAGARPGPNPSVRRALSVG